MKKRIRGLVCLWMAVLLMAVPAVRTMAEGENKTLYVYTGDGELTDNQAVGEVQEKDFNFVDALFMQTNIMQAVSTPDGMELDNWKVWKYYSGYIHSNNADGQPDVWAKDHVITEEEYQTFTGGEAAVYFLLEPVFQKLFYSVTLPSETVGYTLTAAEGSASPVEYGGSYTFTVTVEPGYKASDSFTVSANGAALTSTGTNGTAFTYTIENITEAQEITVAGIVDQLSPQLKITLVDGKYWDSLHQGSSVFQYYNEPQTFTVTVDESSSLKGGDIWYCIAGKDLLAETGASTETELEDAVTAQGGWISYTAPVVLENDGQYVIYAKVEDTVNNASYVNTEMLVIDTAAPEIWHETLGFGLSDTQYQGDFTFNVEDDNLDYVEVDGQRVELENGSQYTITADCVRHSITAYDKAGNKTEIRNVYVFDTYEIGKTATEGGNFTVTYEGGEVTAAEPNSEIAVTASAQEGYLVDEIIVTKTGDESTQVTVTDGKFIMPAYPVTVTVSFRKYTYAVMLSDGTGYTVTPADGSVSPVEHGGSFSFHVTVADGYKVSGSYEVSANGTRLTQVAADGNTYTYTVENITEAQEITVTGVVSAKAPSVTVTLEGENMQWQSFLPDVIFDLFFNAAKSIEIKAEAGSDTELSGIWYCLADADLFTENRDYTGQEIETAVSEWMDYTQALTLSADGNYVLYVKAEDRNGNVMYANTAGIVIDTVLPTIFGVENGGTYYGDTLVRVSDDNLDKVTLDGVDVQLTNGAFTIDADNQTHTVTVRDRAGNQVSYQLHTFETWVRDGIQTGGRLSLTAGSAYRLGSGQWKVSGDETVYEGGRSFYVAESGSYAFMQQ